MKTKVKKHLSKREMVKPEKKLNLKPNQQVLFDYINYLLNKGNSIDATMTYILRPFSGVTKHRKKKEIVFIYENYIMGTIAEKRSLKN